MAVMPSVVLHGLFDYSLDGLTSASLWLGKDKHNEDLVNLEALFGCLFFGVYLGSIWLVVRAMGCQFRGPTRCCCWSGFWEARFGSSQWSQWQEEPRVPAVASPPVELARAPDDHAHKSGQMLKASSGACCVTVTLKTLVFYLAALLLIVIGIYRAFSSEDIGKKFLKQCLAQNDTKEEDCIRSQRLLEYSPTFFLVGGILLLAGTSVFHCSIPACGFFAAYKSSVNITEIFMFANGLILVCFAGGVIAGSTLVAPVTPLGLLIMCLLPLANVYTSYEHLTNLKQREAGMRAPLLL